MGMVRTSLSLIAVSVRVRGQSHLRQEEGGKQERQQRQTTSWELDWEGKEKDQMLLRENGGKGRFL
jgi:hypothetical protein